MSWRHFDEPARIYALCTLDAHTCLAATDRGLWRYCTDDTWQPASSVLLDVPLTAVAATPTHILVGSAQHIARSTDGGQSWQLARMPIEGAILGLALSPTFEQDGTAFAATAQDGVLRSVSHGATWYAWNHGLLDLCVNAVAVSPDFAEDQTVFAATESGLFVSYNGGRAWREINLPFQDAPLTALAVDIGAEGVLRLWVGSEGAGAWHAPAPFKKWARVLPEASVINALLPAHLAHLATPQGIFVTQSSSRAQKISAIENAVCLARLGDRLLVGTAEDGLWVNKK